MSKKKQQLELLSQVKQIVAEYGEKKAPRIICKTGLANSHAQARRYISYTKKDKS